MLRVRDGMRSGKNLEGARERKRELALHVSNFKLFA